MIPIAAYATLFASNKRNTGELAHVSLGIGACSVTVKAAYPVLHVKPPAVATTACVMVGVSINVTVWPTAANILNFVINAGNAFDAD